MISGVWVVVRKACPTTRLWKNALTLFSTVFVVSILHLSFCSFFLVYGVMCGSTFIFLQMATQLPQQHLWLAHLHVVLVLTKTETDLSTFFSQLLCWDWIEIQLSVFPPVGHFFFFFYGNDVFHSPQQFTSATPTAWQPVNIWVNTGCSESSPGFSVEQ